MWLCGNLVTEYIMMEGCSVFAFNDQLHPFHLPVDGPGHGARAICIICDDTGYRY